MWFPIDLSLVIFACHKTKKLCLTKQGLNIKNCDSWLEVVKNLSY